MADIIRKLSYTSGKVEEMADYEVSESKQKKKQRKFTGKRLGSKKFGGNSGKLRSLLSKASKRSKRPSKRKSQLKKGLKNNEAFQGRTSYFRGPSQRMQFSGFKKLTRATSKVSNAFRNVLFDSKAIDDKSSNSGIKMDPVTREAYESLKSNGQPDDLNEALEIMKVMDRFKNSVEIHHIAFSLLTQIAVQEQEGLIENGLLVVILHVFERFQNVPKVLESASVLVWNLATEKYCIKDILDAKVAEKILWILSSHKNKTGPFSSKKIDSLAKGTPGQMNGSALLVYKAIGALKLLVLDENCKEQLVNQGAIELMIHAFHFLSGEAPKDQYPQETCIACVQNFCNGPKIEEYCARVFDSLGHLLVIRSMLRLHESLEIQVAGCAAIWNMSLEPSSQKLTPGADKNDVKAATKMATEVPLLTRAKTLSGGDRRKQLILIGAGTRALAALKHFKEDSRVVTRAMGALKALVQDDESLLETVRKLVHTKGPATKDLGLVNIYDIINAAYDFHNEEEPAISEFGLSLLNTFDIEDEEATNRAKIKKFTSNKELNQTLKVLETDSNVKTSFKEVDVREESVKGSDLPNFLLRKTLKDEFTGMPTPMIHRKDVKGLEDISDLELKFDAPKPDIIKKKPSVLDTPAMSKPTQTVEPSRKISDMEANDEEGEGDPFDNMAVDDADSDL